MRLDLGCLSIAVALGDEAGGGAVAGQVLDPEEGSGADGAGHDVPRAADVGGIGSAGRIASSRGAVTGIGAWRDPTAARAAVRVGCSSCRSVMGSRVAIRAGARERAVGRRIPRPDRGPKGRSGRRSGRAISGAGSAGRGSPARPERAGRVDLARCPAAAGAPAARRAPGWWSGGRRRRTIAA